MSNNRIQQFTGIRVPQFEEAGIKSFAMKTLLIQLGFLLLVSTTFVYRSRGEELKDVEYAQAGGVSLKLDAHIPDGAGPFRGAILVHGGGWIAGDKQQYINYLFKPLADANFVWISINYRLAPKFTFPAPADDVEMAIQYVRKNAAKFKIDPNRIALIGESAGGHLVSYVGAREKNHEIAAVVSLYGVHDFVAAAVEWKPIPTEMYQLFGISAVEATNVSTLVKGSPVTFIHKDMPPYLLMHGSKDEDVPYEQSVEMCKAMKAAGARCDLVTVEGGEHGMDHWEPHPELRWYKKTLVDWLTKTLQ
jgi:acetyl esterase